MKEITVNRKIVFEGHKDCVYSIIPGKGSHFYSAGGDGLIVQWDINKPETGKVLSTFPNGIFSLLIDEDQHLIASGLSAGGVFFLDRETKKPINSFIFKKAIYSIREDPSGEYILIGAAEGEMLLLEKKGLKEVKRIRPSIKNVRDVLFLPELSAVAAGFSDGKIRIMSFPELEVIQEFPAHERSVFSLSLSPDGKFLVSGGMDARLNIWEITAGFRLLLSIPAHNFTINDIAWSPGRPIFATASRDKTIKIWDGDHFELLKVISREKGAGHRHSVNSLVWEKETGLLLSASDDKTIMAWEIN